MLSSVGTSPRTEPVEWASVHRAVAALVPKVCAEVEKKIDALLVRIPEDTVELSVCPSEVWLQLCWLHELGASGASAKLFISHQYNHARILNSPNVAQILATE
ncbi:hypothetical protein [Scytonema sp. NUACC26]|uniref:hypothetical protein n=1 Tax=Scytonema sp. NUACC26 TaxID=3140176 RepID=UPI0034DCA31D